MRKNDPKECATCPTTSCGPCPAMEGEDGAVLALLERLAQPQTTTNAAHSPLTSAPPPGAEVSGECSEI